MDKIVKEIVDRYGVYPPKDVETLIGHIQTLDIEIERLKAMLDLVREEQKRLRDLLNQRDAERDNARAWKARATFSQGGE